jgi:DNA-binding Lrp family transcriptional regulator
MKEEKMTKLLRELIRNSKRSDRELAKAIGASQPTVTRNRKLLEKYIRSYTVVPDFGRIGYEIVALTFAKTKAFSIEDVDKRVKEIQEWAHIHSNIIFACDGEGLGKDTVMISIHRDYSRYAEFIREYTIKFAESASDVQSFIVSLKTGKLSKPFDLTYLSDEIDLPAKLD